VLMHHAKRSDSIKPMAEQERTSRRNRRENIRLLIKAIHRRFDVTRGGPKYLAEVTPHVVYLYFRNRAQRAWVR
jgi:hypothetical protein